MTIRRIGIASKPGREDIPALIRQILEWCAERDIEVALDLNSASYMARTDGVSREELPTACQLLVVLGGDGTLLSAARAVGVRQIPLLAVNLGGMGFMMTTGPGELVAALDCVTDAAYELDSRMVLEAVVVRDEQPGESYFALNDVVVANGAVARLLHLEAFSNGEYVCGYRSDGLIVSTPTGSTAYSLSAGGPVMAPDMRALSLTPICPHTLSNRSVVLPATSTVEILLAGGDDGNYLSVDGQVGCSLKSGDKIKVWRASHTVDIVQAKSLRFFDVLRSMMRWGDL